MSLSIAKRFSAEVEQTKTLQSISDILEVFGVTYVSLDQNCKEQERIELLL